MSASRILGATLVVAVFSATMSAGTAETAVHTRAATVSSMTVPAIPAPVPGLFRPFEYGSEHTAFPTVTKLADGRLLMMWRHGTTHTSADGEILRSFGDPTGTTWSEPEPVAVDDGGDLRDPHLAAVGDIVYLTYFVTIAGVPSGARVAKSADGGSTFGPSARIDPNMPYAAISSPVAKINGKLFTAFYGRLPGEILDSAYAAWSTDDGAHWSTNRIAIGSSGNSFQEPWVVPGNGGTTAVFLMRDGNWDALAARWQAPSGAWSVLNRKVLDNATGNSASVRASNGRIYTIYRDTKTLAAKLASSADNGLNWTLERELMPKPAGAVSTIGMTYAHPIEIASGYLFCPLGMERGSGDSDLYLGWL